MSVLWILYTRGLSGFDTHSGASGGLWYGCTESPSCYDLKYDDHLYFYMAAVPKENMEAKGTIAFTNAHKNFARFITPTNPYCFNTDKVSLGLQ